MAKVEKKEVEETEEEVYLKYVIKKVVIKVKPGATVILQSGSPNNPPPVPPKP